MFQLYEVQNRLNSPTMIGVSATELLNSPTMIEVSTTGMNLGKGTQGSLLGG